MKQNPDNPKPSASLKLITQLKTKLKGNQDEQIAVGMDGHTKQFVEKKEEEDKEEEDKEEDKDKEEEQRRRRRRKRR